MWNDRFPSSSSEGNQRLCSLMHYNSLKTQWDSTCWVTITSSVWDLYLDGRITVHWILWIFTVDMLQMNEEVCLCTTLAVLISHLMRLASARYNRTVAFASAIMVHQQCKWMSSVTANSIIACAWLHSGWLLLDCLYLDRKYVEMYPTSWCRQDQIITVIFICV